MKMSKMPTINSLEHLSIPEIKEKVKRIKDQLPNEEKNIITYSKNFTLSLSNYCQNECGYCFYNYKIPKVDGEGNVVLLSNDRMVSLIQKALQFDCKEALLMSGERPESFKEVRNELMNRKCREYIEFVADICSYLLDFNILPHTNIGTLTYDELLRLKNFNASMGLMLESTSMRLFEKGNVHEKSLEKNPEIRIEHIKNAGRLKIPFTTGILCGIGEKIEERVHDLHLIKNIHEQYGHIQEVIIQNFIYKKGISYKPKKPISIKEMLKITGIARIIFENDIAVQVPPNLINGYEIDFIKMGANDFGGISPITLDYINPEKKWPQIDNLAKICEKNGFQLKERLPIYNKFITKEFCPENIKKRLDNINIDVKYTDF